VGEYIESKPITSAPIAPPPIGIVESKLNMIVCFSRSFIGNHDFDGVRANWPFVT